MPPKRKAAGAAAGGSKAKKGKQAEEPAAAATTQDKIDALKKADTGKTRKHKVDAQCSLSTAEVFEDYNCMLNQTNIGHNNNKFYVIQLLKQGTKFFTWNRWGRVGEIGMNAMKGPMALENAKKDFEKKFSDKTKNKWDQRHNFKPCSGKYTMLDMAGEDEDQVDAGPVVQSLEGRKVLPSKLDNPTQQLMKLIFDHDMFRDAMKSFDIDVKKMPLGKLSKTQIAKGFEVLDELEAALTNKSPRSKLTELSSKFYTVIPHDFGRRVPPTIESAEVLQQKMDMLNVLADIEIAQSLEKGSISALAGGDSVPNPLDENYKSLQCKLVYVEPKSPEYKVIETYTSNTMGYRKVKIQNVWSVDREGEDARFKAHDKITNRKLLWHGTNVAVVAAILRTGLRIMPHSGGRVGSGIYFASENGKSAGYVRCAGKTGIMFLTEVALGNEKQILQDDHTLKAAPSGYDSVVAMGRTEPDSKLDTTLTLGGKKVTVPQGKPVTRSAYNSSFFSQSEYLVYRESQQRLRYVLKLNFEY